MKFEAVVFDLDGTLLNTLGDIAAVVNAILKERGHSPHPTEAYQAFLGHGVRRLLFNALPADYRSDSYIESCVSDFFEQYKDSSCRTTVPYPGIPELLSALVEEDRKVAILSNKPHVLTLHCVEELLGDWSFEAVYGARDGFPRKPDPASLHEIANLMSIPEERILFVGDTVVDIQTAMRANACPIGVAWGFQAREDLIEAGAVRILDHPLDLLVDVSGESQ